MILNRFERLAMNNPLRSLIQRQFEARRLRQMSGSFPISKALEIGCGRGVGAEIILDDFGAASLDAFDLDPRMTALAEKRLQRRGDRVRMRVGDATAIDAPDGTYDAVFDFGIIHHIPDWQKAVAEIHRVLRPGGRFFAEEVLDRFILHPLWRSLLDHPQKNRFDHAGFADALKRQGFRLLAERKLGNWFSWYVADKA